MNIYVGNLAWEVSDDDLRKAFMAYGRVTSASVIKDKVSGRSRGFGFVEMASSSEGEAAITALNGKDMKGRALRVNEARPREETVGPRGGGVPHGGGGPRGGDDRPRRPDRGSGGSRF